MNFSPGDVIAASPGARSFEAQTDWSPWRPIAAKTIALVIKAPTGPTGAGRLWHQLLVNDRGLAWIDGPYDWKKV